MRSRAPTPDTDAAVLSGKGLTVETDRPSEATVRRRHSCRRCVTGAGSTRRKARHLDHTVVAATRQALHRQRRAAGNRSGSLVRARARRRGLPLQPARARRGSSPPSAADEVVIDRVDARTGDFVVGDRVRAVGRPARHGVHASRASATSGGAGSRLAPRRLVVFAAGRPGEGARDSGKAARPIFQVVAPRESRRRR